MKKKANRITSILVVFDEPSCIGLFAPLSSLIEFPHDALDALLKRPAFCRRFSSACSIRKRRIWQPQVMALEELKTAIGPFDNSELNALKTIRPFKIDFVYAYDFEGGRDARAR